MTSEFELWVWQLAKKLGRSAVKKRGIPAVELDPRPAGYPMTQYRRAPR